MSLKQAFLITVYLVGRAFGWCLVSFCFVWAVLIGFGSLIDLWYAGVGLLLMIGSELAFKRLVAERDKNDS
jgi:uncharacterized membrane protein YedE/YeeE